MWVLPSYGPKIALPLLAGGKAIYVVTNLFSFFRSFPPTLAEKRDNNKIYYEKYKIGYIG